MLITRDQPVAAGRVRVELAADLYGEVGGLLHRLDRKVPCRVDHDTTLTAHPGDNGRPIFVVMAPPGLAFLATPPWLAAQRFRPSHLGWCRCDTRVFYGATNREKLSVSFLVEEWSTEHSNSVLRKCLRLARAFLEEQTLSRAHTSASSSPSYSKNGTAIKNTALSEQLQPLVVQIR